MIATNCEMAAVDWAVACVTVLAQIVVWLNVETQTICPAHIMILHWGHLLVAKLITAHAAYFIDADFQETLQLHAVVNHPKD